MLCSGPTGHVATSHILLHRCHRVGTYKTYTYTYFIISNIALNPRKKKRESEGYVSNYFNSEQRIIICI
ncbi:unnamed protein product [Citrullus colocynthis]|uniref:Uncharacterized protein n=1 Tax=Citrullus colocynthis TaxID=252529 RepID=A0ABP0YS72_9ROSI